MAIARSRWGARGTVPADSAHKSKVYVHHTVGPNRRWTAAQEREHMRQLERQHIGQGWSTLGYSFVIFPSGRCYVGRGPKGLPAAQGGANSGSIAIALVGTFSRTVPTVRARARVILTIRNLRAINRLPLRLLGGHRDAPKQTIECPGNALYRWMRRHNWARKAGLRWA